MCVHACVRACQRMRGRNVARVTLLRPVASFGEDRETTLAGTFVELNYVLYGFW